MPKIGQFKGDTQKYEIDVHLRGKEEGSCDEHSPLLKLERREGRPARNSSKHCLQRGDRPIVMAWKVGRDGGGREYGYSSSHGRVLQDGYVQLLFALSKESSLAIL